jgi:tripartite ATP-independent transporter DctM subunit
MVPELKSRGYNAAFAGSLIASCGSIAVIIPPSIPMIIYGIAAQQSVPKLFLAGIVPGLLIGILISVYLLARAHQTHSAHRRHALAEYLQIDDRRILVAACPGRDPRRHLWRRFHATEAAGIACIYVPWWRATSTALTWHEIWQTAVDSGVLISQILIIVAAAGAYSWLITISGVPAKLVDFIAGLSLNTWLILLTINVVLLFFGSVLEPPAAILILTPLLVPLTQQAGVDQIHFGIIVTVNLAIGLFMPPFGLNIFATHALFGIPLPQLYRGTLPFLVIYLIALALITYIPAITLFPLKFYTENFHAADRQVFRSIRDGRKVYVGSERRGRHRAPSVPQCRQPSPRFRPQAPPGNRDVMVCEEDSDTFSAYYIAAHAMRIASRFETHRRIASWTHGLIGRSPDNFPSYVSGLAMDSAMFDRIRKGFGDNITKYYRHMRKNDIFASHTVTNPQGWRMANPAEAAKRTPPTLRVVAEDDRGVTINGLKMLGTATVFCHETWCGNLQPVAPGNEKETITCAIPLNAPASRLVAQTL